MEKRFAGLKKVITWKKTKSQSWKTKMGMMGYFRGYYHWWPSDNLSLFIVEMMTPPAKQIHHSPAYLPDFFSF